MGWVESALFTQTLDISIGPKREIGSEDDEDEECDDLHRQSCDHDVVPHGRVLISVRRRGCNSTPSRLKQERGEIAGDKDARIAERSNARVLRTEGEHNAAKAKIDTGGKEGRGNC